ncbi:uncharacterized protein LOC131687069 [Topomyia yanbarensis]|uniref:uncharacterized protein LOC131687069 n=1 Tax=Topomyia yanbarensis TaxID=2498891 RepID=UPI00273AD1E3|nr:uncharacterized protein LOC131687069 [Topomyia yanbarensis]
MWMESIPTDPRGAYSKDLRRAGCNPSETEANDVKKNKVEFPIPKQAPGDLCGRKSGTVDRKQPTLMLNGSGLNSTGNSHQSKFSHNQKGNAFLRSLLLDNEENEEQDEEEEQDSILQQELTEEEETVLRNLVNRRRQNRTGFQRAGPARGQTPEQLAARHAVSKHLPIFKGEAEVWPLFISCYETTTAACGFTNTDNLKRLQDSLQGLAKEAVQSRLLLPESVPELCDHLEAAGLHDHLSNPMLAQELVSKLPSEYKLDWVRFKRGKRGTPLRLFTDFTNEIVSEVSEVAEFSGLETKGQREVGKPKGKKEFVHTHSAQNVQPYVAHSTSAPKGKRPCVVCKRTDHKVRFCDDFEKLTLRDRLKLVEKYKLCSLCLCDHGRTRCTFNVRCNIDHCKGGHHPLLHRTEELVQVADVECNTHLRSNRSVLFRILPITLHNGKSSVNLIAFLDEGASATLLESTIADKLNADGVPEPLVVHWTANVKRHEDQSRRLDLLISPRGSNTKHQLKGVRTVKNLMLPIQSIKIQDLANRFEHLKGLSANDYDADAPQIIIGLDNLHLFAPLESRVGGVGEPIAVRSALGWTVYGPDKPVSSAKAFVNHHITHTVSNQELHEMLGAQYALEELSTSMVPLAESNEDKRARDILQKTTVRVGDRFETGLLWKNDVPDFPDSYPMAVRRLKALERRLSRNPELQQNVFQQIVEYQRKEYCHKATKAELGETATNKVWYLPLNVVLHPKKPDKVRLVWDAAAAVNGTSLNSNLLKGPDLLTSLPAVICKFREKSVAFGGDVREMYHQLRIREADKQAQRFLFRFESSRPPEVYVMDVATNWASNSEKVLRELKEPNQERTIHFHQDKVTDRERVLGLIWDTKWDVLSFSIPAQDEVISSGMRPTKRQILSIVMSLFDPLGLLTPFTVLGKMLVQALWRTGCDWDEPIDDDSNAKWQQWTEMLPEIERVRIPRSYFGNLHSDSYGQIQLHVFCDAGENAYGCVGYLRIVVNQEVSCSLVMARSKVAPLRQLTIPRLELQAAVLAAQMIKAIRQNHSLEIHRVFIWSDSQTVLSWIQSDQRKYKQFVGFRIGEILSLSNLSDWRWIPSKLNIADCLTKWGRMPSMEPGSSWFRGQEFIYQAPETWPQQVLPPANTTTEMRAVFLFHDIVLTGPFIDTNRISKWNVLIRTVACLYRFISNCRRKCRGQSIETLEPTANQEKLIRGALTATRVGLQQGEYRRAEEALFRMAQSDAFGDEIKTLRKNQELEQDQWIPLERSSPLHKMTLLLDSSEVLRLEGRTANAEFLPFDLRFPVVLPKDNAVTARLVQYFHAKCGHAFRETVKSEIKQRFVIPKLSSVVANVEKHCVWCKVHKNRPSVPRMAALPIQRLTPYQRPFTFVGVDYLGSVEVTIGRRAEKRWIVVFTCLVVRAIHLEVAHSLNTQSCLMAIRRFNCRRGSVAEYFSDNGTNFRAASKEIQQLYRDVQKACAEELTDARTQWHFNPPAAPHMGGVWERMVRTVKEVMSALNDGRRLTEEILQTTLCEAEDMINSRPLVFAPQESPLPALTPNTFLRGSSPNEPQEVVVPTNVAHALRDSYKRSQLLADEMWKRWIREYVPSINSRTKWFTETRPLQKGDLVYVVEGDRRKSWMRGVIEKPIMSSDGRVRQAIVRTNSGTYKRPVAKLAVLEIAEGNADPVKGAGTGLRVGDCCGSQPPGL